MTPRFSIVVPTRNRATTLQHCLRTCLDQTFDDYEIVVCDNASEDRTREVVASFASKKIRYLRAEQPLAMVDNWNLAISNAAGDYITVVGDDDGVLPNTLKDLAAILDSTGIEVIRWPVIYYYWPGAGGTRSNRLKIPLGARPSMLHGVSVIRSWIEGRGDYNALPMLYNSVVHKRLIGLLRGVDGAILVSGSPDVYSGFAIAYLCGEYVTTGRALTICGISSKSNGLANLGKVGSSPVAAEFAKLNAASGAAVRYAALVPDATAAAGACGSFLAAKERFFADARSLKLSARQIATRCMTEIESHGGDGWEEAVESVRRFCRSQGIEAWFHRRYASLRPTGEKAELLRSGFDGWSLVVDASRLSVQNVQEAAVFCNALLSYDQPVSESYRWPSVRSRLGVLARQLASH